MNREERRESSDDELVLIRRHFETSVLKEGNAIVLKA
jgi:hypothetical protein